jgi:[acyl-carrier-protein] S-malonyltransferase
VNVALVFPGQGSQRIGMLDALPDPLALGRLLDAGEALSGLDLRTIAATGTPEELSDTRAAQPLLFLVDWAWGIAALKAGVVPGAIAGHSLGELAALAVAGVYSVEAGLEMVVERSRLMAACAASTPGRMSAVIGLDAAAIHGSIDGIEGVWVANDNAPGQVVISGTDEGIAAATTALSAAGARRIIPLQVAGPFHTPLMAPAAEAFAAIIERASFVDAPIPVYSNADPRPTTDAETLRERLAAQIIAPVRWTETMAALAAEDEWTLLEAGPGAVLSGLAKRVEGLRAFAVEQDGIDSVLMEGRLA